MFSASRVVAALAVSFGSDPSPLTYREEIVAKRLQRILEDGMAGQIYFEDEESENEETEEAPDEEWNPTDEPEETFSFGTDGRARDISENDVMRAIDFYRQPKSGSRTLASMSQKFRWVKSESDLRRLRRIEGAGKIQRNYRIRKLAGLLYAKFLEKRSEGAILDDDAIRDIGETINFQEHLVDNFAFSHSWLQRWKGAHGVTHRRATKIVSILNNKKQDEILANGKKFVEETRALIQNFPLHAVLNCDQSGFVKEFMSSRTLDTKGAKKVLVVAQSKSATTHSYTVMPSLRADGTLGEKLYVVMSEATGKFPTRVRVIQCHNLIVRPAKSHMMTKALMLDWVQHVVLAPSTPQHQLLIVDSWSSFKDHDSMKALLPPGKQLTIRNIPDSTTSFCQPLDIFFFGPFKKVMRKMTNYIKCNRPTMKVYSRDTSLKMVSLVYELFRAPCFQGMLEYPWKAAGYTYAIPAPFLTPAQKCFDPSVRRTLCQGPLCPSQAPSFILCPNCDTHYCFDCYFVAYHRC